MINGLLLWVWHQFTSLVEGVLDPAAATRAQAFKEKVAAAETAEADAAKKLAESERLQAESEVAYQASIRHRAELADQLKENQRLEALDEQALTESQERRKKIADELVQAEKNIADRPDTDRIDQPLPGTTSSGR